MQAFVSAAAVEMVLDELGDAPDHGLDATDIQGIRNLHDWALQANAGKVSGLIDDAIEAFGGELPGRLGAEAVALTPDCPAEDHAAYEAHLARAENADVVVLPHHCLASCAMFRRGRLGERGFDVLVVDQVDRLRDVADQTFRFTLSLRLLEHLLGAVGGQAAQRAAEVARQAQALLSEHAWAEARGSAVALVALPGRARRRIDEALAQLADAVKAIAPARIADAEMARAVDDAATVLLRVVNTQDGELFA